MQTTLRFHGGRLGAAVPLVFFVIWAISISVAGAPDENGLVLGMVIGLVRGHVPVSRNPWSEYADQVFAGMANPVATVTIVAWFWAGMFAQVLQVGEDWSTGSCGSAGSRARPAACLSGRDLRPGGDVRLGGRHRLRHRPWRSAR